MKDHLPHDGEHGGDTAEGDGIVAAEGRERHSIAHGHRDAFDAELAEVQSAVLAMGAMVEDAISRAKTSLVDHDVQAASRVVADDRAINDAQEVIDRKITTTIATQGPVAADLRFLLALNRVTFELERMGDYAAGVGRQARKLGSRAGDETADLDRLGELANGLLHDVLLALVSLDVDEARRVAVRDDEVDAAYRIYFDRVVERMRQDPSWVDVGTRLLFAAHNLERIGDRATNVAEDIVFLGTGAIEDLNL